MSVLFAFAAAVQVNDPDPIRWIAMYGAACALSLVVLFGRRPVRVAALAVSAVAIAWAALIALGGPVASDYEHMLDAWEMKSASVEEAREASGLLIVAVWMIVLLIRSRHSLVQA
jgi:Transmembrane family 220, helix